MRIGFFVNSMHDRAGTEGAVATLSNYLCSMNKERKAKKRTDYEVSIIEKVNRGKAAYDLSDKINIFSLSEKNDCRILRGYTFCIFILVKLLNKLKLDVLVINTCTHQFYPLLACKITNVCSVVWEHFGIYAPIDKNRTHPYLIANMTSSIVSTTCADSTRWKKLLCKGSQNKISYIPLMTREISQIKYDPSSKVVLAIGRLTPQKGFEYLLDIWNKLQIRNGVSDWKLLIVGSGFSNDEKAKAYECKIKRLISTTANVTLIGTRNDLRPIYEKAGIFVLTSRYEGRALVLQEAQSLGIPAVAFNCPSGPSEIIDNDKSGYLIQPFDIKRFSQALYKLVSNEELRQKFSAVARKNAEKIENKCVLEQWDNLLRGLHKAC